jgi:hypothetical protein
MPNSVIAKYQFQIRTRGGVIVDHLAIFGRTELEARAKLCQMYVDCEVLACRLLPPALVAQSGQLNYEDVVDLIIAA